MTEKVYSDYFRDILNSINEVEVFVKGMTYEEFIQDKKTVNAVIRSLEVLGEATKNIPNFIREEFPRIPWQRMAGMRDKLIHEYFGVDLEIVWEAAQTDLPNLRPLIAEALKDIEARED